MKDVPNRLFGVMLSKLQRLRDVLSQLRMIQQEVHRVLDALGADGHADVVEPGPQRIKL